MALRFVQFVPSISIAIPGANPPYKGANIGSWDSDKIGPGRENSSGAVVECEYDKDFVYLWPLVLGKRAERIKVPMCQVVSIRETMDAQAQPQPQGAKK